MTYKSKSTGKSTWEVFLARYFTYI